MNFHIHVEKTVSENFNTRRSVSAILKFIIRCEGALISDAMKAAEEKGFRIVDIHPAHTCQWDAE